MRLTVAGKYCSQSRKKHSTRSPSLKDAGAAVLRFFGGAAAMARLAARVLRMEQQADWLLACYGSCAAIRNVCTCRVRAFRAPRNDSKQRCDWLLGSCAAPPRFRSLREFRRSYHPAGILRQTRAILATGSLSSATRRIRVPVSVIHGKADPLVRPVAAEQLGYLMPHARVEMIDGMGHDLPEPLLSRFAQIGFETMAQQLRQGNG